MMLNAAEQQLKFENAFQQVLISLATRFINTPVDQMDQTITEALRQIVEFLGGMRASINRVSADRSHFTVIYHWSSSSDPLYFPETALLPESPETIAMLERGEIVRVANFNDLPEDNGLRRFLMPYNVASLVVVPIMRQQTLIGFVA